MNDQWEFVNGQTFTPEAVVCKGDRTIEVWVGRDGKLYERVEDGSGLVSEFVPLRDEEVLRKLKGIRVWEVTVDSYGVLHERQVFE